jgi:hypothetical protein
MVFQRCSCLQTAGCYVLEDRILHLVIAMRTVISTSSIIYGDLSVSSSDPLKQVFLQTLVPISIKKRSALKLENMFLRELVQFRGPCCKPETQIAALCARYVLHAGSSSGWQHSREVSPSWVPLV